MGGERTLDRLADELDLIQVPAESDDLFLQTVVIGIDEPKVNVDTFLSLGLGFDLTLKVYQSIVDYQQCYAIEENPERQESRSPGTFIHGRCSPLLADRKDIDWDLSCQLGWLEA